MFSELLSFISTTNSVQIVLGELVWAGSDTTEVAAKILNGERPSRPWDTTGHDFTIELWRMLWACWGKDPDSRISIAKALQVLEYL